MQNILFFDLEIDPQSQSLLQAGALLGDRKSRSANLETLYELATDALYLAGHNIIAHDLQWLKKRQADKIYTGKKLIDTLLLSVLLRPDQSLHSLDKDHSLITETYNNPLEDCLVCRNLLLELNAAFKVLKPEMQAILAELFRSTAGLYGYFHLAGCYTKQALSSSQLTELICSEFSEFICCSPDKITGLLANHPSELGFALSALALCEAAPKIPIWLNKSRPAVLEVLNQLRFSSCGECNYCQNNLLSTAGLQRYFGFTEFRKFVADEDIPLQQRTVEAALRGESLLAVFPTGGGKSLTFQLPALMQFAATGALTIVISPLQSLMKDQVDVLKNRREIICAETINGSLTMLERNEVYRKVSGGDAGLFYLSPESLRSEATFRLLKSRNIARLVIDEAHCFSGWGHDFRVDYLYIGKFLNELQADLQIKIPVSCFTATARSEAIADICGYFSNTCQIEMQQYITTAGRKNLFYEIHQCNGDKDQRLVGLLEESKIPGIVYCARTKRTEKVAEQLKRHGWAAAAYHGKMEREEKQQVQERFIKGELEVISATSAFGMGVDKENVETVIHYNISSSLENYLQEAGRAARSAEIKGRCAVLFEEEDIDGNFVLLNQSKISHKEIAAVWQGIKRLKRKTPNILITAHELAKYAGWHFHEDPDGQSTRLKNAVSALEDSGYVERLRNSTTILITSLLTKNFTELAGRLDRHKSLFAADYETAKRLGSRLLTELHTSESGTAELEILADQLGEDKEVLKRIITKYRQAGIVRDDQDLKISLQKRNISFPAYTSLEEKLWELIAENCKVESIFSHKELYNQLIIADLEAADLDLIGKFIRNWRAEKLLTTEYGRQGRNYFKIELLLPHEEISRAIKERNRNAAGVLELLTRLRKECKSGQDTDGDQLIIALGDLQNGLGLFGEQLSFLDLERSLLFLHHAGFITLDGGFTVFINRLNIRKLVDDPRKQYTLDDYRKLSEHYALKTAQLHITARYCQLLEKNSTAAQKFVADYFSLPHDFFVKQYFNKRERKSLSRPISDRKYQELFGSLSDEQKAVINDSKNDRIMVAAGPGSGKTRTLIHKVASLLLLENVRPEQFLMLTFSRAASCEIKERLYKIADKQSFGVDIFTFHSYAFHLLGKPGSLIEAGEVIALATAAIREGRIENTALLNKSVLMIDEYQDVSQLEFDFIQAIIEYNEQIRVIAVGDDDQAIYGFRGASVSYMFDFIETYQAKVYYLTTNYRSVPVLVDFANSYLSSFTVSRVKATQQLQPANTDEGILKINRFKYSGFYSRLVDDLQQADYPGTTAVICQTNDEAIILAGLLREQKISVKLMGNQDGYSVKNLLEVQCFTTYLKKQQMSSENQGALTSDQWQCCLELLKNSCGVSADYPAVLELIRLFEKTHHQRFYADWLEFITEPVLNESFQPDQERVVVTTVHKAKGREFDNLFFYLDGYRLDEAENQRRIYVALTRAKQRLHIYTGATVFDSFSPVDECNKIFTRPELISCSCAMKGVNLGSFKLPVRQETIKKLRAGDRLFLRNGSLFDQQNNLCGMVSKHGQDELEKCLEAGYQLLEGCVEHIVVWHCPDDEQNYRVILPMFQLSLPAVQSVFAIRSLESRLAGEEIFCSYTDGTLQNVQKKDSQDAVSLPLYGKIAAGQPLTVEVDGESRISIPRKYLSGKDCFALTIKGDSMQDAGICDGDVVIIKPANLLKNGQIAAVEINGEATLKEVWFEQRHITLKPRNPLYQPVRISPEEFCPRGVAVAIVKRPSKY